MAPRAPMKGTSRGSGTGGNPGGKLRTPTSQGSKGGIINGTSPSQSGGKPPKAPAGLSQGPRSTEC